VTLLTVTLPITDGKTLILFSLKLSLSSSCNNTTKSEIIEKVTLSVEKKKKKNQKNHAGKSIGKEH